MTSNSMLWARREKAVAQGVASVHQKFIASAHNATMHDTEGTRYIDFATGIAVCNTGHSDPRIMAAVKAQLDKFSHVSFQVTPYEIYIALAEKLNALALGDGAMKSMFVTSGAEAVENAVKIARAYTGRHGVIAFRGGYHGRTMMTLALTGKVAPYQTQFGPMPAGVFHGLYPSSYLGISDAEALASLDNIFTAQIAPSDVAAIILEPVLGEGGFYVAPPSFLQKLRLLCDSHGILLIADEIQTGFARTGKIFAMEYSGVAPHLMTVAKAMAGGFPIAGVVGEAAIMDAPHAGGLGGTYGGSPLACAAALTVLDIIESDGLCARAVVIGEQLKARLTMLRNAGYAALGDIRGLGAMVAVELVTEGDKTRPDAPLTKAIITEAGAHGLILLPCGLRGNVVRFLPALTASDADIAQGLDIFESAIHTCVPRTG